MANPGDFVTIVEKHVTGGPAEIVQDCTKVHLPELAWGVE